MCRKVYARSGREGYVHRHPFRNGGVQIDHARKTEGKERGGTEGGVRETDAEASREAVRRDQGERGRA